MPWNPQQYERFKQERFAPFEDLLALVAVRPQLKVVDLGCGTGELTARLAAHLPQSQVTGLDSSAEMLSRSATFANTFAHQGLQFEQIAIENLTGHWDLIFSHAALQWCDDHPQLFSRLWQHLRPGGQLAVQMPSNHQHRSHQLLRELAGQPPFVEALAGWSRPSPVLGIEAYAQLLYDLGASEICVFEKVYPHLLASAQELLEWVKGTAMLPYLERLPAELQAEFIGVYSARIAQEFPQQPLFYGFRRTLLSARLREEEPR